MTDTTNGQPPVLRIRNLKTYFYTDLGISRALNGVNLDVPFGKVMGLVGESGCGKSVTSLSVMRLVPKPGRIVEGQIIFNKGERTPTGYKVTESIDMTDLDPLGPKVRSIRGRYMAMIFQEPMTSLNPSYTVGNQVSETIILHQKVDKEEAMRRAIEIVGRVGLPNPEEIVKRYPHELSGGMRQRAMVALALSCRPTVLFADEPTTALDVTTEAQILDLMRELQAEMGMTIVFITHNLGVVAQMCDTVGIMYLGRIVELADVDSIFYNPKHPYTSALLRSIPHVGSRTKARLAPIRGVVPDPYATIPGCPFHPRCDSFMKGVCDAAVPAETDLGDGHMVRCFLYSDKGEVEDNGK
ncbi:MAG: ABC transporter ATP-binding protein [Anaerolineales bacterium]